MKATLAVLIVLAAIVAYFWLMGMRTTVAPTDDFVGPKGQPSVVGPKEPPPQN